MHTIPHADEGGRTSPPDHTTTYYIAADIDDGWRETRVYGVIGVRDDHEEMQWVDRPSLADPYDTPQEARGIIALLRLRGVTVEAIETPADAGQE
jgi:hypothetical protein